MFNSIKLKLVIWFLALFSMLFIGVEYYLYKKLDAVVVSLVDDHLASTVQSLANLMTIEESHAQDLSKELNELSATASGEYAREGSGHYYQILSANGDILVRSPSLLLAGDKLPVVMPTKKALFETIRGPKNEQLRIVSKSFEFHSVGTLTFQAGDDLKSTYSLVNSFRNIVLYVLPAVFLFCVLGVYVVTGWALKSLKDFSGKVGQISEKNLNERIEEKGTVQELRPLAASFNTMLGRLESSFSRQKQFLSDASHELRTPTSIIRSFCDVTLGRERSAEDYRDALKKVSDTVNRMCDIINRILVISRIDTQTMQFKATRLDLMEVLKDVLKIIELSAANKGVRISLKGAHAAIYGDREGLTEVFSNIVENAVKYNIPEGRIDIEVSQTGEGAMITVSDTGIGIPANEIERIFDRFYRVDASRGVTVGSGLGLSIVRSIIENHGGKVEVESVLGKGSVFKVSLPANPKLNAN